MPPRKVKKADHSCGVTREQFSFFCWLRLHPEVAKTYGITDCDGLTTIGSMLLQTLRSQGAAVDWYERLPEEPPADAKPNQRAAAWIKKVGTRPSNRLKSVGKRLEELAASDHVAPPPEAAVRRRDGKAPRLNFPLIAALNRMRKRRCQTSNRNNPIVAPAEVALAERACVVEFVESKLRCGCGARLHFDSCGGG